MGLCILGPSAPPGWSPIFKATHTPKLATSRRNSILKRFFNHFDVCQCGKLGEEQIIKLIHEFLNEAEELHFYLYGQEFGRRLAKEIPLDVRLSGVSYDIWRKEFSERPEKFLSTCAELFDPGTTGAGDSISISKNSFLKNATASVLENHQLVDEKEMNEIMPNLFLGSEIAACDKDMLNKHGITHILSIGYNLPKPHRAHFEYCIFDDVEDYALENLLPYFEKAHRFMDECLASGGKILVHCQMGVSRSASTVSSFLMRMNRWDFDQAVKYVQSRRAFTDPNIGFQAQLIEFHKQNYSYDMKSYENFNLRDHIIQRMKWGLCNIRQIIELVDNGISKRNHEMRFFTLLFASSQEVLEEFPAIKEYQQQAVRKLRYFQEEYVGNTDSLNSFDRMFKDTLDTLTTKAVPMQRLSWSYISE